VRRVADRTLLRRRDSRIVMRDLSGVAVGATRHAAMSAPDDSGREVVMTRHALDLQASVAAVSDHLGRQLVVTERTLTVDLVCARRCAAVPLRAVVTTRSKQDEQTDRRGGAASHRSAP